MGIELLAERHTAQIAGGLGCRDQILIFGTLPGICFAGGMTPFRYARNIRIFDYPKFAEPFRNRWRKRAFRSSSSGSVTSAKKKGLRSWTSSERTRPA
jgi:hypothetical protein